MAFIILIKQNFHNLQSWKFGRYINSLSELIQLAFLVEFNEEAVEFLMKSKNMQIFVEDEEFLSAAFPSGLI